VPYVAQIALQTLTRVHATPHVERSMLFCLCEMQYAEAGQVHELVGQLNLPPHVIPVAQNLQQILKAGVHPGITHPGEEIRIGQLIIYLSSNIFKLPTHHTDRH